MSDMMVKLSDLRDSNNLINNSFKKLLDKVREEKSDKLEQENLLTARVLEELIMFIRRKEQYACCPPYNIPKEKKTPVERKSSEKRRRFEGEDSTTTEERVAKKAKNKNNEKDSAPPYNIPKKKRTPVENKSSEKRRRFEGENSTTAEEREAKKAKNKNNEKDSAPPELPKKKQEAKKDQKNKNKEKDSAPRELPVKFKNMIIEGKNGKDIKLVIQKRLSNTDISDSHNRLLIPSGQVKSDFLFESEEKELVGGKGIIIPMIEPCLEESVDRLCLKRWNMGKTSPLALITGWKAIKSKNKNGLESGVQVQLWSYRIQKQLCFALVKVEDSASTSKGNMVLGQVPVIAMAHKQADSYGNT